MNKIILSLAGLLFSLVAFGQGTQVAGSPIYHNPGTVNVGGNSNVSLFVRHLNGKEVSTTNPDNLYLNYNTGKPVFIGGGTGLSNLYVSGKTGIGTSQPLAHLHISGQSQNWNESIQGRVVGSLHLDPENGTDHFGSSITFGASDNASGNEAQAGIYTRTDAVYGSKMYFSTTNSYLTGAQTRMMIDNTGKVGIGTSTPGDQLHVIGNSRFQQTETSNQLVIGPQLGESGVNLSTVNDAGSSYRPLKIYSSVTEIANGKLIVQNDIESKKVKVSTAPGSWPDYVFESDYQLAPLSEVEAFVNTNKHLPEVPAAKEVESNGQDLGEMQATLLKKVEELTLYLIEQNKKQLTLEERLAKLEAENTKLKALLKQE